MIKTVPPHIIQTKPALDKVGFANFSVKTDLSHKMLPSAYTMKAVILKDQILSVSTIFASKSA